MQIAQEFPSESGLFGRPAARRVVAQFVGHRGLLIVLALGLVVRLILLAASAGMPLNIIDEQHYTLIASNIVHGDGFAFAPGRPTSMRPPLYPAFIAGIWTMTGTESLQAVRAAQIILSLLTTVGIYLLALRLFSRRVALGSAAIVCFYPSLLFSGLLLLTETIFTFLVVAFALQYALFLRRPGPITSLGAGAVLGLAALARSVLWPFPVLLAPLMLLSVPGRWPRRIALAGCAVLGFALVLAPWVMRNTTLQRTLTIVDTMGGMNLMMGNYAHTPEDRMWDAISIQGEKSWAANLGRTHPEAEGWTDGQKEKWAQREAVAYMLANPGTTARRMVLKFADFWGLERELIAGLQQGLYQPPRWAVPLIILAVIAAYPLVALGAGIGVVAGAPQDWRMHALLMMLVLIVTAVHTVVFGHSRYHLPLVPFLSMYAANMYLRSSWRPVLARPWVAAGSLAACGVLLAVWSHEVLFRDAERIQALLRNLA
jgi:4-amino-4-deoxy-L-arabinose transferase-like glycosyltransferase